MARATRSSRAPAVAASQLWVGATPPGRLPVMLLGERYHGPLAASMSGQRAILTVAGGIICNHCSYIDILVLLSRYFPSFVARSNTQDMPFIGLCRHTAHMQLDPSRRVVAAEIRQGRRRAWLTLTPCICCAASTWNAFSWTGSSRRATGRSRCGLES